LQHAYLDEVYDRLREIVGPDLDLIHLGDVRRRYSAALPNEMVLLDVLEELLPSVNRRWSTNLVLSNDGGTICAAFEVLTYETEHNTSAVRTHVKAMKDLFRRMSVWFEDDGGKARQIFGQCPAKI
jgi:hypothetical protein